MLPIVNATLNSHDFGFCMWDYEHSHFAEPLTMELFRQMPLIHFKPADSKKKVSKGLYTWSIYMPMLRPGSRERPSFIIAADIKSGIAWAPWWAPWWAPCCGVMGPLVAV